MQLCYYFSLHLRSSNNGYGIVVVVDIVAVIIVVGCRSVDRSCCRRCGIFTQTYTRNALVHYPFCLCFSDIHTFSFCFLSFVRLLLLLEMHFYFMNARFVYYRVVAFPPKSLLLLWWILITLLKCHESMLSFPSDDYTFWM